MAALIKRVEVVVTHPTKPHLSVITLGGGIQVVSMKIAGENDDQVDRYNVGDLVIYIGDKSIVLYALIRDGFWDTEKDKGGLAGPNGNRVKASNFGKDALLQPVRSEGIVIGRVQRTVSGTPFIDNGLFIKEANLLGETAPEVETKFVVPDEDVSHFLRVTEAA